MAGDIRSDERGDAFNNLYAGGCGYFEGRTSHETIYLIPSLKEASTMLTHGKEPVRTESDPALCQRILFDIILAEGFRRSGFRRAHSSRRNHSAECSNETATFP